LEETDSPSLLVHGSVAAATTTISGFLIVGWPTWHQASWHQMGFAFLKGEEGLCSQANGAH